MRTWCLGSGDRPVGVWSPRTIACAPADQQSRSHERLGLHGPQGHVRQLHPQEESGAQPHAGARGRQRAIMRKHGVEVDEIRAIDHDIATGVYPDMTEHGWETDAWPDLYPRILGQRHPGDRRADLAGRQQPASPSGSSSGSTRSAASSTRRASTSSTAGSAGCLITGNEDGIKHCAQNVLYSLQHVGYTIPPTPTPAGSARPGQARRTSTPAAAGRRTTSPTGTPRS